MRTIQPKGAPKPDPLLGRRASDDGGRRHRIRRLWKAFLLVGVAGCLFLLPTRRIEAMTVRALSLEELTLRADRIFVGRCIDVRDGRSESGQPVTEATFSIVEPIKGVSGERLTIRQFRGGRGLSSGYAAGEEVLLFLHADSATGLTSPVGLSQGRFTVLRQGARRERIMAVGDGARAGRRALRKAIIPSGTSKYTSAHTSADAGRDDEHAVELAPLIRAARRIIAEAAP